MNLADTIAALKRRWYIVVTGILVAVVAAYGAWTFLPPSYERSATVLLLPGSATVPDGQNPYLYLGGLGQAADVIVSAIDSNTVLSRETADYPGTKVTVQRDPINSGPAIDIQVTSSSDRSTGAVLKAVLGQVSTTLESIQDKESVPVKNRISVTTLSADDQSTIANKTRLLGAAGAAIALLVVSLLVAAMVDGLSRRRRRGASVHDDKQDIDDMLSELDDEAVVHDLATPRAAAQAPVLSRAGSSSAAADLLDFAPARKR